MQSSDRTENREKYIDDISSAIRNLVERCGGSLDSSEGPLPRELVIRQRDLFVHSGITGVLSMAIMEQDRETIEFFDWLLGYHISKVRSDQSERNKFIVAILMSFQDQIIKDCGETRNSNLDHSIILIKMASMVLDGSMDQDEIDQLRAAFMPTLVQCMERNDDKRRRDAEKN